MQIFPTPTPGPPQSAAAAQGGRPLSPNPHKGPASPRRYAAGDQKAHRRALHGLWPPLPVVFVTLSPTAGAVPRLCALQQSQTHTPGPPTQQCHSSLSRASPQTSREAHERQAHGETGLLRLEACLEAWPPSADHPWGHTAQLLAKQSQEGAGCQRALPPPGLRSEPCGAGWLRVPPTSSDLLDRGRQKTRQGRRPWEGPALGAMNRGLRVPQGSWRQESV